MPQIIGDDLLARDADGKLKSRIATVFPRGNTIVTLPGIHATQRIAYVDSLNAQRIKAGLVPLTDEEQEIVWMTAVDLVLDDENILIRPDPGDMDLAFEADDLLQECASKKQVKFLHVLNPQVHDAIKRRGECWRINPLPRSPAEMSKMIAAAKIGIGGNEIYYYSSSTGTRHLTCQEFDQLGSLPEPELRSHLIEIHDYSTRCNRMGNPEIDFYRVSGGALATALAEYDFESLDAATLKAAHDRLWRIFCREVEPAFRFDDPSNCQWRSAMFATLIDQTDKAVSEEALIGLSAEFFMQVEWVPGGRVEDGELILDPVFEEEDTATCCPIIRTVCDMRARSFIFNFVRDYGDMENVNIGRVAASLSHRGAYSARRGVYLAEITERGNIHPILRIIRMQKYGVWEHLDEGKDLLAAILQSEEYTEYILDRRLGCRQLGMNLPPRVTARKISEKYTGSNGQYRGVTIWSPYFERDYVAGLATDKIPTGRFADDAFALAFARLLGRAAAPNLILGRCDLRGAVVFDDGDELLVQDHNGAPADIVVTDHTGTFMNYQGVLSELAPAYLRSVDKRAKYLANPRAFAERFVDALTQRFTQIQRDYLRRKRAFDTLFKHGRRDEGGSFAFRWEQVLDRLLSTKVSSINDALRGVIQAVSP